MNGWAGPLPRGPMRILAALTADLHPGLAGALLERAPAAPRRVVGWGAAALAALLLAIAAVAVALAAAPGRPAAIAPARPAAVVADQFSPFIAYAALGWPPADYKLLEGGTTRGATYQVAWRPSSSTAWYLLAYPAGEPPADHGPWPHVQGVLPIRAACPHQPGTQHQWAPRLLGHRLRCLPVAGVVLAWQHAPGSWAVLELGNTKPLDAYGRQEAVKAASHARFGVHAEPPVAFPVQLTGLPASWHLISGVQAWMPEWNGVTYQPDGHVLYASHWSVSTGSASTGPRARPYLTFTIGLAGQPGSCRVPVQGPIVHTVVNGYRVIVTRGPFGQALRAANARGLSVQIEERSNRPGAGLAERGRRRPVRRPPATAGY